VTDLATLREELDRLDAELIGLAARRMHIAKQIAATKERTAVATRDFAREREVIEQARTAAARHGLAPDLAEQILLALIEGSLGVQERHRLVQRNTGAGRRALVIGGAGKMGRWFADYLASQGFEVVVSDPAGPAPPFTSVDWSDIELDHDLLIVATPLRATPEVLHELASRRPSGVVFDVGSLKSPLVEGLYALRDAGVSVTSVHPMFGPDTELLSGQHVLFCDVGSPRATATAQALFADTMAIRQELTLDEHDRVVAFVLGLSHALNIAFFTALRDSGEAAPRLSSISSTTFDAQLGVARRVAGENPHLYYDIQALNEHGHTALDALRRSVAELADAVADRDEDRFVALMERGSAWFTQ